MRTTLTPGFSTMFFLLLGVAMTFVATAVPPALDFCERLRSRWRRAGRSTGRTPQRGRSAPARDALPGTPWRRQATDRPRPRADAMAEFDATPAVLDRAGLGALVTTLAAHDRTVIGPTVRDAALVLAELAQS